MKSNASNRVLIALYFALTACAGIALNPQSFPAVAATVLHFAH